MQDLYNIKTFELHKINDSIASYRQAIYEVQDKISSLENLCGSERKQAKNSNDKTILEIEKEKLQQNLLILESKKEKLNEELIDSEDLSELIKIKYALLLSNYAVYHDNPTSNPKAEARNFMQKILEFNKKNL